MDISPETKKWLLVDFENVQQLENLDSATDFSIIVFVGNNQKSLPFDLVKNAQPFGAQLEWLKIEGNGNNALDFHIAYYLGKLYAQSPKLECYILSKDSGFDPLISHSKEMVSNVEE